MGLPDNVSRHSKRGLETRHAYHHQHRNEILRVRLRQRPYAAEAVLPQNPGRPALDVRDLRHLQEISARPCLQPVPHVVQNRGEHAPAHALAELDHSGREAVARLSKVLDHPAGNAVTAGDG